MGKFDSDDVIMLWRLTHGDAYKIGTSINMDEVCPWLTPSLDTMDFCVSSVMELDIDVYVYCS